MITDPIKDRTDGFSLLEVIIAIGIITIGVLSLAGTLGFSVINGSRFKQVTLAKYIAVTTAETIISARESQILSFNNIGPQSGSNPNGFVTGVQSVKDAGPDHIYGTADDTGDLIYTLGPNTQSRIFDDVNDQKIDLTQIGYRRQITITDMTDPVTNLPLGLKQIQVTVFYPTSVGGQVSYTLTIILGDYRVGSPS